VSLPGFIEFSDDLSNPGKLPAAHQASHKAGLPEIEMTTQWSFILAEGHDEAMLAQAARKIDA